MESEKNTKLGFVYLLLAAVFFSTAGMVVRGLGGTFGGYGQVVIRALAILAVVIPWIVVGKKNLRLDRKVVSVWAVVWLMVFQPIGNITFAFSAMMIKATNSIFYLYVGQLLVGFLLGWLFREKKLDRYSWLAIVLAVAGLVCFSYPVSINFGWGAVLGMACGASEAVKNKALNKIGKIDVVVLSFYLYVAALVGAAVMLVVMGAPLVTGNLTGFAVTMLVLTTVNALLITKVLKEGFKNLDPNLGNVIIGSELLFAAILNMIFLKEVPTGNEIAGGIFYIVSLVVIYWRSKKSK